MLLHFQTKLIFQISYKWDDPDILHKEQNKKYNFVLEAGFGELG